jgi:methylthioribose-1-phosphate isomerase
LLDQRALPHAEVWLQLRDVEGVAQAIETLAVRGAPAIGGAAALALALHVRTTSIVDATALQDDLDVQTARLARTRPTAVNLFFALDAVTRARHGLTDSDAIRHAVVDAAERVVDDDEAACTALGNHGAPLLADGDVVLTICHTGALATCGQGTALGIVKAARAQGKDVRVVALETRPLLQGARLTSWECLREGIPVTLITDGMAAFAFQRLGITRAIAGADRVTRRGDVANKIGTYGVACLSHVHDVPFLVAAPTSTFDLELVHGSDIVIEERAADEVRKARGDTGWTTLAPVDVPVWNPAFDVTPAHFVHALVTERGVLHRTREAFDEDAVTQLVTRS